MEVEVKRMGFDMQNAWRVSDINSNYKLCSSYPQKLLVPVWITDKELESVASFRSWKRIPVVVYRHQRNGAVIARCSQPEISWWGWRNTEDEYLVTSIAKACQLDAGTRACRTRGDGPDSSDSDFDVCNAIRASALSSWLSALESTRWLQHLSVMLKAATLVCSAVEREGRPVLVHCSDGWDRTPQIVALAKILLDPFYRTIEGFQVLVETEWLDYGHKFADRCGHQENVEDVSEQCPVFLQWLDCVHQLLKQFPCLFEFNEAFLVLTIISLKKMMCCTEMLPKTRSMDNLVSACENGVTLTRTSSDPNLNKHCQEGRPALESNQPAAIQSGGPSEDPPEDPPVTESPPCEEMSSSITREDDLRAEPCLTTQPLPSLPHPLALDQATPLPVINQAPPPIPISLPQEIRTAENTNPPPLCNGFAQSASETVNSETVAPMEASVETLTEQSEIPPARKANAVEFPFETPMQNGELVPARERPPPADYAKEARRLISQSQLTELSLLGSQWDSVQGLVQSACGGAIQHGSYHGRRLANKLLRAQGGSANGGPCCRRDPLRAPGSPIQSGWFSAVKNSSYAALCSSAASSLAMGPSFRQLLPSHSSPSSNGSPALFQTPAYLDDDGLPVAVDAVQQRLRQIEASYKQEVEVLRRQVRQLQLKLESKQFCTPPSEPDVDYEDDITCLRESDGSDEEDSLSNHSEDRFSEGSWDRVERKDTEVTRWVPDHMASHCFNCDCEFWIAKRRHHCRNCGNVFCKDCCHLKLPIPDQQLYDPVLVCNTCYDLLLESRTRELRSQQLKKAIATASS
ncbi:myotubularin-related 4 isoform X2 [Labeo rohita]|uniref:phosphatidylinositol-3,5-bisphosphate 3-phosphatase n=1 Tax=Labeo rohita TaxID=84645 RepID=A0A498P560_LABRO|nr:myotubularin-related 4 isoform X2 [Labeo rohita]